MKLRRFVNLNPGGMQETAIGGFYRHDDLCAFLQINPEDPYALENELKKLKQIAEERKD